MSRGETSDENEQELVKSGDDEGMEEKTRAGHLDSDGLDAVGGCHSEQSRQGGTHVRYEMNRPESQVDIFLGGRV